MREYNGFKVGDVLPEYKGNITYCCNWWKSTDYDKGWYKDLTLLNRSNKYIIEGFEKRWGIDSIKMGSKNQFSLYIKNGTKIYHKLEDITQYVKDVYDFHKGFIESNKKFNKNYDFKIKDVILEKTGCENTETKLSEWVDLYKMLK